ncbi:Transcriptional regulator, XRE family [Desulfonema limicola]|uniref:Transcriptional regulator, XRE family n=1 Tax=Desulfonema limicola TaxID=45656 RepID=A0A975B7U3_9BACT|nr:helix-turn-helix domain-containing protein [Desulfonema limicola]QTA80180.1 Transcriptional regulator, XRE family [Desulfonema limicola]
MISKPNRVSSGVSQLDRFLGGLFIGDNVVWYDDAGSLASAFCMNFIQASLVQNKSLVYVSFDRSPKNLVENLGHLAENQHLTILDCFTHGKGDGSEVFSKFYEKDGAQWPYQIIKINEPWKPDKVIESIYGIHKTLKDDVRFVFESLTGMQDLWGGEEHIQKFYTHSCPRLYELNTIAYWIIEKGAHSGKLKAHINQIAQVAIDLSIKRGKSALTILKADKRNPDTLNTPNYYWNEGMNISFESDKRSHAKIDIGIRLKQLRTKQGLSQTELAKMVGVTPSTISQIESNIIYPSLTALFKIAETLCVEISSFFQDQTDIQNRVVFSRDQGVNINFPDLPKGSIAGRLLTPVDFEPKAEPYIIEIPANQNLGSHFFIHKGEEIGYVLSGTLQAEIKKGKYEIKKGDIIYLTTEMPSHWKNPGPETARLLWIKIK